MVYILAADKPYKYKSKLKSSIIYIGTTGIGAGRPAASAANKASEAFYVLHGVKTIHVHLVTCRGVKATPTWKHLEDSLLALFRERYWQLPKYNRKIGAIRNAEDITLFQTSALLKILKRFDA